MASIGIQTIVNQAAVWTVIAVVMLLRKADTNSQIRHKHSQPEGGIQKKKWQTSSKIAFI